MFEAPGSEYLVPFDNSFRVSNAGTQPRTNGHSHKGKHRRNARENLNKLQRVLAAGDRRAKRRVDGPAVSYPPREFHPDLASASFSRRPGGSRVTRGRAHPSDVFPGRARPGTHLANVFGQRDPLRITVRGARG